MDGFVAVLFYLIFRFGRSKRRRVGEVVRTEHQVQQTLRVRIVAVIEIMEAGVVEIASFC